MKFTCNQQILNKALSVVSKAVTTKTTLPILKGILLQACNDGTIILSASDLDVSIERTIPDVSVEKEGSAVVSAKLFCDIIRKLPNEDIHIEQDDSQNISIRSSFSSFSIIGISPDEFPNIGDMEVGESISFSKGVLKDIIRKSAFSASIDESKGVIVGVLIELTENQVCMVALDGFRMAVIREEMKNEENRKIIISAKIMSEINKIISDIEGDEEVVFNLCNKKAIIMLENTKIVLRLMEGEFIKYRDILPRENRCKMIVNRDALLESVERASLLSKEGKNNLIKMTTGENNIVITSRSEEGNVREEVEVVRQGEDIEIGFNSKYLLDVLKVADDEEIVIELNSSIKPCLIKPASGDGYEYLILPVRIASGE